MLLFSAKRTFRASVLSSIFENVVKLCKEGLFNGVPDILRIRNHPGIRPDSYTYADLLQACVDTNTLPDGKLIHAHIIQTGFNPDVFLGTKLVIMYAKCGSLADARRALDEMPEKNVVSWTAMIAAYAKHGYGEEALVLFYQMQRAGVQPNQFTFGGVLPACATVAASEHGKNVHQHIIKTGFSSDVFVASALVDMYAKCESITDARHVFDKMPERNVISWNAMMVGCIQNGHGDESLRLFQKMPERNVISWNAMIAGHTQNGNFDEPLRLLRQMQLTDVKPNSDTLSSVLPTCANLAALREGKEIHEYIIRSGCQPNVFVESALVDMYAKCRSIVVARKVFDNMASRDVVSWNAMISGYVQNGQLAEALDLFQKMPRRNVVSWTAMITGYAQNAHVVQALKLFLKMPERNAVSWSAMIAGYAQNGHFDEALELFRQMQLIGLKPNSDTFASVLQACTTLGDLHKGKEVHEDIIGSQFQSVVFVGNALVDMYAKCKSIAKAEEVFDKMARKDVVSWNVMITGYAQNGQVDEALKLFQKMPEHNEVSCNAMIAGYSQNGQANEAWKLFHKLPEHNVVTWTAMIAAYAQNGHFQEALRLFQCMQLMGVKPNADTFASVLSACSNLAALHKGKGVHQEIIRSGFHSDIFVGNALADMYAKCGSIEDARKVFDLMDRRDTVSWTVMIVGYAMHGCGMEALHLFQQMQHSSINPDHVTFIGVLSACCHAGLVDDGWQYFDLMSQFYHITPAMEHYCCMVDLLGRAGHLSEALDFINKMPIKPDATVWGSLLGACRIHTNVELGKHVAEHLFNLDPQNAAHYVLLSNMYAAASRWDEVDKVRKFMKERRVKKVPGCSWIEVNNKVYAFGVGDRSHPQMQNIYAELEILSGPMKEAGYVADASFVLHDGEEEQKENMHYHNTEKWPLCLDFSTHLMEDLSGLSRTFKHVETGTLPPSKCPKLLHEKLL